MKCNRACVLLIGLLLLTGGSLAGQRVGKAEVYQRPPLTRDGDLRIFAHSKWITTKWDPKADAHFKAAELEAAPYRDGYVQDLSGQWPLKARAAYSRWRVDCQNPLKLHRACVYFDIARAVDQSFGQTKEDQLRIEELRFGWDILRNPPASYLFVRRGYGWNAGDFHRHNFGALCSALLKGNPLDRYVGYAGIGELWDEMGLLKAEFEQMLIATFERVRKTPAWSFRNHMQLSSIYEHRAMRTTKRSDMDEAIKYAKLAMQNAPKGFDVAFFEEVRDKLIQRREKYMKID